VNRSERKSSLTIDAFWLLLARTASFFFSLALPLFLIRHLNQVDFGLYKQAFLVVSSVTMMAPLGFGMSALYFLPREPGLRRQAVLNILLFNFAIGALAGGIFVAWPFIVELIFGGAQLVPYSAAMGVLIMLWTAGSAFDIVAVALNDMKTASAVIFLIQITRTTFVLTAGIAFGSLRALVFAAILQGVLQVAGFVMYLQFRLPEFWRHFDFELLRRQLSYALPLGAAGLLYTFQADLHSYFVSHRFGPALFAIYAIGTVQLPLVTMLQESATSVLIPRVSVLQRNHENHEIIRLIARAMRKLAAAYLPIYAVLLVTGRELIRLLFTDRYLSSWPVFAVNLTLLLLSILPWDPLYRAYTDQRYFLIRVRAVLLLVMFVLLWFGSARYGLMGAISAVVVATFAERVVTGIRFGRILGVSRKDLGLVKDLGKLALAASGAALLTAFVRGFIAAAKPLTILAVCGILFAGAYAGFVALLGILSREERDMLSARIRPILPALRLKRTGP
jgi:O-antigen/teichoic acid export membrane protein